MGFSGSSDSKESAGNIGDPVLIHGLEISPEKWDLLSHVWLLRPNGLQHARLPCLSPTPRAYSNSCSLSRWCHPTILCCPLLLLPSIFPSIKVFFNELAVRIRWPKYWNFSFSISPSNEYSGLISLRIVGTRTMLTALCKITHLIFSATLCDGWE